MLKSVKLEDNNDSTDVNRYYMPNYSKWLHEKLTYIIPWSNLCLGDLQRFNPEYYDCKLPETKTNSVAEPFFCLKKRNRNNVKQLIVYFISKSWHNNRGLQRQFILDLRSHICDAKTVSKETTQSFRTNIGNEHLHSDVIVAFLQHLLFQFHEKFHIEVMPSQALSPVV